VGIAFKVDSSFKLVIPILILTSTNWNFRVSLQCLNIYLLLPTRILGFRCNTYTHTCFYQVEFWGFVAILTLVLASTKWNFGASLQYLHSYFFLLIGILGLRWNTYTRTCFYQLEFWGFVANIYTHTYLYQLEFWGLIAILALVHTSTNFDFGA
jgi:hypothetical protein